MMRSSAPRMVVYPELGSRSSDFAVFLSLRLKCKEVLYLIAQTTPSLLFELLLRVEGAFTYIFPVKLLLLLLFSIFIKLHSIAQIPFLSMSIGASQKCD